MQYGKRFEKDVVRSLRGMGCVIETSWHLDVKKKCDVLVTSLRSGHLRQPVRVQITLRKGNEEKLREFVSVCKKDRASGLYVDVEDKCPPILVAFNIVHTLEHLARQPNTIGRQYLLTARSHVPCSATAVSEATF